MGDKSVFLNTRPKWLCLNACSSVDSIRGVWSRHAHKCNIRPRYNLKLSKLHNFDFRLISNPASPRMSRKSIVHVSIKRGYQKWPSCQPPKWIRRANSMQPFTWMVACFPERVTSFDFRHNTQDLAYSDRDCKFGYLEFRDNRTMTKCMQPCTCTVESLYRRHS